MEKEFDVIALGELLIDFTMNGTSGQGNQMFEACPGGAPCNVLAMLNKLGKKTAFIGKVGKDQFGIMLKHTLEQAGINTDHLYMDSEVHTTLALVHTLENGDRDFSFYRNPGADMMLTEDEVDAEFLKKGKLFHFGTLSMTHEGIRKATKKALKAAKEAGMMISFDPNLRPPLWDTMENAKEQIRYGMGYCDILKISDNEIQFITGKEDYDEGVKMLEEEYHIPLILLTMGADGSRAYYKGMRVECGGFSCDTIETTGAGDTFCGSALSYLVDHGLDQLTEENLKEMLTFANAAAAIITTRKGAIRSMPEREEVENLIRTTEEKEC
nr:carbohydrate kinase [uncultured Sellimonas sp.]